MRVLVLPRYERLGSSSRVRFYQYFPYLQSAGVEITSIPFFDDDYVRRIYAGQPVRLPRVLKAYLKRLQIVLQSSRFDILWIEKELFPWMPPWFEGWLGRSRIPYVVDYDDAVFHRYDMHRSALVRSTLGHKIDRVMKSSALVVAGNEYLAERAKQAGAKRVELLPSVVDVSHYQTKSKSAKSPFQIGWIGSPVTAPYLAEIQDALTTLAQETAIHVILIGAENSKVFPGILTTILPWDEQIELSLGNLFDVGIMPLTDGPFERGKCGYKLVQYMAAGLPVVASPVGVNRQMVEWGNNGYLAVSAEEWVTALRNLIYDEELRSSMGRAGRQKVEQMYNLQVTAPRLLNLLSSVQRV